MKKGAIVLYTAIMFAFSFIAVEIVSSALMGHSVVRVPTLTRNQPKPTIAAEFRCDDKNTTPDLTKASVPELKKLAEYQEICHSQVTSTLMIFNDMPNSEAEARDNATKMSSTLKEFASYKVTPLVITEPVTSWGDIDFTEFKAGFYDQWIGIYFQTLKSLGITDEEMGVWVPFPEANLPYWNRNNATPADFGIIVNKYLGTGRQSFPKLRGSIMLNSATYSADDFDWARGEYLSLVPYVKAIDKNLVESFGLQGFPWMPPANRGGAGIFDASEFLNYKLAQEAADALGVKKIWFNTGTFGKKYVGDTAKQTLVTPERRTDVLSGILVQASELKNKGYSVAINLFSEDKSETDEATDWSYFSSQTMLTSPASPVFTNFAARASQQHIELWLFDRP